VKTVLLRYCAVEYKSWGCITRFPDGNSIDARPHPELSHYHVVSHRCGYGDDLLGYAREHEIAHAFIAERFHDSPSYVLSRLANGEAVDPGIALLEEIAAQTFQRWVRANERPILAGADWDALKADFLALVN
jgi:hypothetical protein